MTFRQTKSPLLNVAFMNTIARQQGLVTGGTWGSLFAMRRVT